MQRVAAKFAILFLAFSILAMLWLTATVPLDSIAAPNGFIAGEIGLAMALFVILMALSGPIRRSLLAEGSLSKLLSRKLKLPLALRLAALVVFLLAAFIFAFYATMDVLGSYNGPQSSLLTYPGLHSIYDALGLAALASLKFGVVASIFLLVALFSLVAFSANRGLGSAIKDAVTLFVAPVLMIFEFGLWYYAPEDMTWHATAFLWIGGINDHGYRAQSLKAGVTWYPINNWLVLFVALLLVASRVPAIWQPERMRKPGRRKPG